MRPGPPPSDEEARFAPEPLLFLDERGRALDLVDEPDERDPLLIVANIAKWREFDARSWKSNADTRTKAARVAAGARGARRRARMRRAA